MNHLSTPTDAEQNTSTGFGLLKHSSVIATTVELPPGLAAVMFRMRREIAGYQHFQMLSIQPMIERLLRTNSYETNDLPHIHTSHAV